VALTEIPAAVDRLCEIAADQGFKVTVVYAERLGKVSTWIRVVWIPADKWQATPEGMRPRMQHPYPDDVHHVLRLSHWLGTLGVDFSDL
jgi:hypothetical protein